MFDACVMAAKALGVRSVHKPLRLSIGVTSRITPGSRKALQEEK